jgi:hypothetical protein
MNTAVAKASQFEEVPRHHPVPPGQQVSAHDFALVAAGAAVEDDDLRVGPLQGVEPALAGESGLVV